MKRCTYCGKEYPDEAKVCSMDGQPVEAVTHHLKYYVKKTGEAFHSEMTFEELQAGFKAGKIDPDWGVRREDDGDYDWITVKELCGSKATAPSARTVTDSSAVPGLKSKAIGVTLAFIFCPIGLFYASAPGAFVLILVAAVLRVILAQQDSVRLIMWFLLMFGSALWASKAIDSYNKRVEAENNPAKAIRDLRRNRIQTACLFAVLLLVILIVVYYG